MESPLDLGKKHLAAGRVADAEACFRQAVTQKPDDPEAQRQLAAFEYRAGRFAQAAEHFGLAARANPNGPEDYCNWGMLLIRLGRRDEAIAALRQALAIRPQFPEALYNLGIAYREQNQIPEAIDVYRRSVALRPNNPEAHNNLGNALVIDQKYDEAIGHLRKAVALVPNNGDYHYNLGIALQFAGKIPETHQSLRRAIELNPGLIEPYTNLGVLLTAEGKLDEAVQVFRRGLEHKPDAAMVHWNLSHVLLLRGEFAEGWQQFEWRRKVPEFLPFTAEFTQPIWDGSDLRGQTILLYGEQGFGDTIHFARFIPLVAARGGKVVLACQPKVLRLMRCLPNVQQFVSPLDKFPDFQLHCPVLSLPRVMNLPSPQDVPWTGPYLKSEAENRQKFADVIGEAKGKLKIGLVWAGRAVPPGRSIPLKMLAPLARPSVHFFSLQIGEGSQEAKSPPPGMNLIDVTSRLTDFADTAALIDQLDLIIGIDTAVTQLAGALGKPVWTLLKRVPDWRWLMDRDDSPWYPTMRLFRQKSFGDWPGVIQRVADMLAAMEK